MDDTCFACGATIPDGLKICGQYLCPKCETELIHSNVSQPEYEQWIDSCRRLWERIGVKFSED